MIATFGYYIIFLFNVVLTAALSFIIYYLNNKNSSEGELSFFSTLSIIIVSMITVANSLSDTSNEMLLVFILSLFIFLGFCLNRRIKSDQQLITYMLFVFMPILIGMGFYVSTISSIVVIFSMKYFLNGVLNFFTDHNDEFLDADINQIDDNDSGVNFDDEINEKYESKNDKINGK
tara:strand:- start:1918 stop:2445 length:528 start_codon:yes stop_codon:yes gene_type:complete